MLSSSLSSPILLAVAFIVSLLTPSTYSSPQHHPWKLKCYCNHDGVRSCDEVGTIMVCEFDSFVKTPRNGTEDDDYATCTAAKHPTRGIYYSCGWGSRISGPTCDVRVGRDGVAYDFCRCNNEHFCNENFFEDEVDETAVDTGVITTYSSLTTTTSTGITADKKNLDYDDYDDDISSKNEETQMTKEEIIETTTTFAVKKSPSDSRPVKLLSDDDGRSLSKLDHSQSSSSAVDHSQPRSTSTKSYLNNDYHLDDNKESVMVDDDSKSTNDPMKLANIIVDSKNSLTETKQQQSTINGALSVKNFSSLNKIVVVALTIAVVCRSI